MGQEVDALQRCVDQHKAMLQDQMLDEVGPGTNVVQWQGQCLMSGWQEHEGDGVKVMV